LFLVPQRVPDLGGQPGQLHRIRRQAITDAGAPDDGSRPTAA